LDKVPSNVELRRIIMHMPVHGKALFLTLASSGMRIGEALKLKVEDVDLDTKPVRVNIRGEYTKTGNSRVAFVSREAAEAIQEWLKVRSQYIEAAAGKSHRYGKPTEDQRLFPFEANTAYAVWKNALRKAGFLKKDAQTNRHTVHPHVLRKFFRTRMGSVIPVDVVEALMGHEGYLTEVYRRYSHEDLARFYSLGEAAVSVLAETEELAKLRVEVEERNRQLQALVNGLTAENLELKQRMQKLEQKLSEIEKALQELTG
jgi:integrase